MKITDLNLHGQDRYPYKYRLDIIAKDLAQVESITDWAENRNIPCIIGPNFGYFETKEDAMLVALRWL